MDAQNNKILIIESDRDIHRALERGFMSEGFEVLSAFDGETGLKMIEDLRPLLVILDVVLPNKNGFEIMQEKKQKPELSFIPVVVLSNLENSADVKRMFDLGAVAYLVKADHSLDDVIGIVKGFLGREISSQKPVKKPLV